MRIDRPALVLGSTQRADVVDSAGAERRSIDVVRRRSGGGAVLLTPDDHVWIDLLVPAGDPRWDDDVTRAAHWAGECWAGALEGLGWTPVTVHRGGLVKTEFSRLVCFAGLGPGEVSVGPRKVMGLSQRRSRSWTRIQTIAYLSWRPGDLVSLLALDPADRTGVLEALETAVSGLDCAGDDLAAAVLAALPRR